MKRWQQYHRPPRALRRAQLDNILLIPASALPEKARYQALANDLPAGDVLIVVPRGDQQQRHLLDTVTQLFRANGHAVTTVSATTRAAVSQSH